MLSNIQHSLRNKISFPCAYSTLFYCKEFFLSSSNKKFIYSVIKINPTFEDCIHRIITLILIFIFNFFLFSHFSKNKAIFENHKILFYKILYAVKFPICFSASTFAAVSVSEKSFTKIKPDSGKKFTDSPKIKNEKQILDCNF